MVVKQGRIREEERGEATVITVDLGLLGSFTHRLGWMGEANIASEIHYVISGLSTFEETRTWIFFALLFYLGL